MLVISCSTIKSVFWTKVNLCYDRDLHLSPACVELKEESDMTDTVN